ncbi:MAG: hypothetical protein Q8O89_07695 [Nanoarchaeota archaeon]|nr:hypothetical protein [Nanoarchaeota archaeon]
MKKLPKASALLFLVLALSMFFMFFIKAQTALGLQITEIMYDSVGTDDGWEYIEIAQEDCNLTNQITDIESLKLFENNVNHNLVFNENYTANYGNYLCGVYVIAQDLDAFSYYNITNNINISLFLIDSAFSLSNTGEYISIRNSTSSLAGLDYSNLTGYANGNGFSLQLIDGSWQEKNPTPGVYPFVDVDNETVVLNDTLSNVTNDLVNNDTIGNTSSTNMTIVNTTITNSTVNPGNVTQNETALVVNSQCNVSINIYAQDFFEDNKVKFFNVLSNTASPANTANTAYDFEIEYWIEDIFGTVAKNRITTANTNQKSWTAGKQQTYIIKNRIKWIDCDNVASKKTAEKIIIIRSNSNNIDSGIDSTQVSDNPSETNNDRNLENDLVITAPISQMHELLSKITMISEKFISNKTYVNFSVYKGNTSKNAVHVWIDILEKNTTRKISDIYKTNIYPKYSQNEFFVELNMKNQTNAMNCSQKITLVIEGLGITEKKPIISQACQNNVKTSLNESNNLANKLFSVSYDDGSLVVSREELNSVAEESLSFLNNGDVNMLVIDAATSTESNLNKTQLGKEYSTAVYSSNVEKAASYSYFIIPGLIVMLAWMLWKKH